MTFLHTLMLFFAVQSRLSFSVFPVQDEETSIMKLKAVGEPEKEGSLENKMENMSFPSKDASKNEKEPTKVMVPQADFMLGIAGENSSLRLVFKYYISGNIINFYKNIVLF